VKRKPSPRANGPPLIPDLYPTPSVDDYVIDSDTPVEAYFQQPARREINGKALPKNPVILLGWAKIGKKKRLTTGFAFGMKTLIVTANNGLLYVEVCMSSIHNHNFSICFTLPALKKRVLIINGT